VTPDGGQLLWRIAKHTAEYEATDLTGGGARATGGRWNSKGKAVVYASTSIALATLETLAHLGDTIAIRNAFLVHVAVPASVWSAREMVQASQLDPTWLAEPPGSTSIRFGDEWLASKHSPLLLVPSVIVPEEFNVLINPAHPGTALISAAVSRQFIYDPRL
jgi:RES domain-containing protein